MNLIKYIFFRNITPATFEDSLTYLEQLNTLKDKVNEIIDVINEGAEVQTTSKRSVKKNGKS